MLDTTFDLYLDDDIDREDDAVQPMNILDCPNCGKVASPTHNCTYCGEHCE